MAAGQNSGQQWVHWLLCHLLTAYFRCHSVTLLGNCVWSYHVSHSVETQTPLRLRAKGSGIRLLKSEAASLGLGWHIKEYEKSLNRSYDLWSYIFGYINWIKNSTVHRAEVLAPHLSNKDRSLVNWNISSRSLIHTKSKSHSGSNTLQINFLRQLQHSSGHYEDDDKLVNEWREYNIENYRM